MNPPCAKCFKSVYPVEKLSILDKFWHKSCFKCTSCGMSLNLKNFKGYNKEPYCNAHYPKTEHTSVADDPENRRLMAQSKIQSSVEYHKDFEKAKGSYTAVADDPESLRIKNNSKQQSQVAYRTDISTLGYTVVTDDPESARLKKNSEVQSQVKYKGLGNYNMGGSGDIHPHAGANFAPEENNSPKHEKVVYESDPRLSHQDTEAIAAAQKQALLEKEQQRRREIEHQQKLLEEQRLKQQEEQRKLQMEQFQRLQQEKAEKERQRKEEEEEAERMRMEMERLRLEEEQKAQESSKKVEPVYRAEFDYEPNYDDPEAADELAFKEGDVIINVQPIDDGWCTGTNERTGRSGMLPRNYIAELS